MWFSDDELVLGDHSGLHCATKPSQGACLRDVTQYHKQPFGSLVPVIMHEHEDARPSGRNRRLSKREPLDWLWVLLRATPTRLDIAFSLFSSLPASYLFCNDGSKPRTLCMVAKLSIYLSYILSSNLALWLGVYLLLPPRLLFPLQFQVFQMCSVLPAAASRMKETGPCWVGHVPLKVSALIS